MISSPVHDGATVDFDDTGDSACPKWRRRKSVWALCPAKFSMMRVGLGAVNVSRCVKL